MKIILKDVPIQLSDLEVKKAKKLINDFFDNVKKESVKNNVPSFYFTSLIVGYVMLLDSLNALTPNAAKVIMEATKSGEEQRKKIQEEMARYGLKETDK